MEGPNHSESNRYPFIEFRVVAALGYLFAVWAPIMVIAEVSGRVFRRRIRPPKTILRPTCWLVNHNWSVPIRGHDTEYRTCENCGKERHNQDISDVRDTYEVSFR